MTTPSLEFYTVEIQRPHGDGWATVHTDQTAAARDPHDAAWHTLKYRWPVSIYDKDPNRVGRRRDAIRGIAGYRVVVTPASHNRRGASDALTAAVADVALHVIADATFKRRAAKSATAAARKALKEAQNAEWAANFDLGQDVAEAALMGVPDKDIARAKRIRTPRKEIP